MIISYSQSSDNPDTLKIINKENFYLDNCSSVIPFNKREKGSLILALINQKKISKIIVPNISVLGRNQIDVLNTIDFFINNDVSLFSQAERLETMDEYGRVKPDTILFLNLFKVSSQYGV
jgi:DNA invertase Pin-like site-specific DNA recombinase